MNKNINVPAELLAQVLMLLNDQPRFAPRDRLIQFDSYSTAAEISYYLRHHGIDPQAAIAALPRE